MNFKTTFVMFYVLLGMLGLFALVLVLKGTTTDAGYVLPAFHSETAPVTLADVTAVEIAPRDGTRRVFIRRDDGWHLKSPEIRLEGHQVNQLLREVTEARREEEEEDVVPGLKQAGLDPPEVVITLKKGGSKEWTFNVGKQSPLKDGVAYVNSSERGREVIPIKKAALSNVLNFNLDDYRPKRLLDANPTTTQALTLRDPGKGKEVVLRKNKAGSWYFVKPQYGPAEFEPFLFALSGREKRSPGVRELLQAVDNIQVEGFEPLGQDDPGKYGLEDSKAVRIVVENRNDSPLRAEKKGNVQETLLIGKKVEPKGRKPGTKKPPAEYYARLLSEKAVVRIGAKNLDTILETLAEQGERLRSLKLTQLQPSDVDAIDIRNEHGLIRLRRDRAALTWKISHASTGVRSAQGQVVQALLSALREDNQVKEFLDRKKPADLGLDKPAATVSLWVGGLREEKPEAKDKKKGDKKGTGAEKKADNFPSLDPKVADKPTVRLSFGSSTKDLVYVSREADGEVNRVAVPASLLTQVEKGPLAYLDRNLAPFVPTAVARLVLKRGTETLEAGWDEKARQWKLKGAKVNTKADAANVQRLLTALAQLNIEKWVKVKPTKDDLKQYGLEDPSLTATVTTGKGGKGQKVETFVFSFGNTTKLDDNRTGVYGLVTGTDVVFAIDQRLARELGETELRDRTVFPYRPAEVTDLLIQGYNNAQSRDFRLTLHVKRKPGQPWQAVKVPDGFKVDDQKVGDFLNQLAGLRLHRFVKPDAKAAGLDDKDRTTLTVTVRVRGEDEAYELRVGKADGKEPYYFARSSSVGKDNAFLLSQADLSPLLGTAEAPRSWISFFKKME
jgi:hypothetical protein